MLLFTVAVKSYSQDLPQIKHNNIEDVVDEINIFKRTNRKTNSIITSSKLDDTLVLDVRGKDNVLLKYTFNLKNGGCNFQTVDYLCSECAEKRLNKILNQGYLGWRKLEENKYLSNYFNQTELEVIKNEDNTIRIVYQYVNKSKEEYKILYKKLAKFKLDNK